MAGEASVSWRGREGRVVLRGLFLVPHLFLNHLPPSTQLSHIPPKKGAQLSARHEMSVRSLVGECEPWNMM